MNNDMFLGKFDADVLGMCALTLENYVRSRYIVEGTSLYIKTFTQTHIETREIYLYTKASYVQRILSL